VSSARAPSLPPNSLAVTSSTTDWLRRVHTKRTHSRCSPDGPSCMVRMDERARAPTLKPPTTRHVAALCPSCTSKLFLAVVFTRKRGCVWERCVCVFGRVQHQHEGDMLHASQEPPCSDRVRFWNSPAGRSRFLSMVASHVSPPPNSDDPEPIRSLRSALPPGLIVACDADADRRAADAARGVAERLRSARSSAARYHDAIHLPPPPRHSVYSGSADRRPRSDGEMEAPPPRNSHFFERWKREQRIIE
jgi:hypothetical protein